LGFEASFPRRFVSRLASRETASRRHYRPIYSLHRWWARRPGTVFRSMLLAAFAGDETAENMERRFFEPHGGGLLQGKLIVDPFMGGGTTVFEALRLGASVVGLDVNPVAWWIVKQGVDRADPDRLEAAYRQVEESVGATIHDYYLTRCPLCNSPAEGLYYFWVKELTCPHCGRPFLLHPDFRLARHPEGDFAVYCPRCHGVDRTERIDSPQQCSHCGHVYVPGRGRVHRGRYVCPHCGDRGRVVDELQNRQRPLDHGLVAVEYHCPQHGRGYKRADEADLALYEAASHELTRRAPTFWLPSQRIRPGTNTDQMRRHGYRYWRDMFNDRQLLGLGLLSNAIALVDDTASRELMTTLFSEVLDYNNMFCDYNYSYRKIGNLFGLHAFNVSMRPVENNLWGGAAGSGTFSRFFRKLVAAKSYARRPSERDLQGHRIRLPQEAVSLDPVVDATALESPILDTEQSCVVLCRDSRSIPLADGTVDAVVTDPPYFDNVMYGELSEFYYVWLHGALGEEYPEFMAPEMEDTPEIISNPGRGKGPDDYVRGLSAVFAECHRILRRGAPLVFTFHHRSIDVWVALLEALTAAGFVVESTVPVHSEMSSSIHIRGKRAPETDVVVACRRRSDIAAPGDVGSGSDWKLRLAKIGARLARGESHPSEDTRIALLGKALTILSTASVEQGFDRKQVSELLSFAAGPALGVEQP